MDIGTLDALFVFALAVVPGVLAFEAVEFGRPPLRPRNAAARYAFYLVLSVAVWTVAVALLGAEERLVDLIELDGAEAESLVDVSAPLVGRLLLGTAVVALALRGILAAAAFVGEPAYERLRGSQSRPARSLARLLAVGVEANYAWDELLARLRRSRQAQLVQIRLKGGSEIYGLFAEGGLASYEAQGRGLLLDRELVLREGSLTDVPRSTGMFVPADAVASVSFASYEQAPDRSAAEVD